MIFEPIDRIWNSGGFQPSIHSETASSTIFYLWVWKMTFSICENPKILSTPGWLYTYIIYLSIYSFTCLCGAIGPRSCILWAFKEFLWGFCSLTQVFLASNRLIPCAQSRSYSCTLRPKVGMIYILGTIGICMLLERQSVHNCNRKSRRVDGEAGSVVCSFL